MKDISFDENRKYFIIACACALYKWIICGDICQKVTCSLICAYLPTYKLTYSAMKGFEDFNNQKKKYKSICKYRVIFAHYL